VQTRAHLEAQLASALALKSPNEYRQCLLSYIRFLAREADEPRLREVCESFLGPPTGMADATSTVDRKNPAWDPCVLGMKKHKLLREDILPAMASNRKVQRLLNEFMDLLSEYEETIETNPHPKNPSPPLSLPSTNPSDTTLPTNDPMDSTPPLSTAQTNSEQQPSTDQTSQAAMVEAESVSPITEQMSVDPPVADPSSACAPTNERGVLE